MNASLMEARLSYEAHGLAGPRVLLVHAIGFDRHSWEYIVPRLERDYQVVAVDLPGHGESDKPLTVDYGLWSMGRRVVRFLDELGWEDAILVGNSIGGGVSLSATLQAPKRVKGLALLNSVAFPGGLPLVGRLACLPFVPLTAAYTPTIAMRIGLETVRSRWGSVSVHRCRAARSYFRSHEGRAAFFRALRQLYGTDMAEMSSRYAEIRCPTLVLHGESDPLIRLPHAERLAEVIPHAELAKIARCGHFPQEECPKETLKHLEPFLAKFLREEKVTS